MNKSVLDFSYVARFGNEDNSKATVVENQDQILHFLSPSLFPCKITGGMGEISELIFRA